MATLQFIVLIGLCVTAWAIPQPPITRNTIFGDELLKGEIFEGIDTFDEETVFRNEGSPYRLPNTTVPTHYDVLWAVDLDPNRLAFSGSVDITLEATQSGVTEIVLHCKELTLSNVTLRQGSTVIAVSYTVDETDRQFLTIDLNGISLAYDAENPVSYILSINFEAPLRDDMSGLYKSWYRNSYTDATVSWMASTQYQSTSSRSAFPCYDEPRYKATFNITVRRQTAFKSWSNTYLDRTVTSSVTGYQDDIYTTTPVMSTYLIAILVANYESIEIEENGRVVHDVIGRPGAINAGQGAYANVTGKALVTSMSNYTGIEFYSSFANMKMTQASIPDFSAGAMENWGLLTYREAYLMYDDVETSSYYKQIIAYILSHEVTHMWFGNLVTCEWWDVTWLNEGFARYYQYFLTSWVETEMGFPTRFVTEQVHTALLSDAANNPHPLTNPGVGSPDSVGNMFSTITYNKGAAVIRMTEHLLGKDVHDAGLREYLTRKAYDYVYPEDLFTILEEVGTAAGALEAYGPDFDFVEYYKSWTEVGGHPVLNVRVNHATGDITITQRRFNINTGYSTINTNWIIPITFATGRNPDFEDTKPTHVIKDTTTVINRGYTGDDWIIFNKQQANFYRVNYDDYTWDLITISLKGPNRTLIHEYNRAQIVNDVFQFARSGLMTYTRALSILSFLENETSYAPWAAAITGFSWLRNRYAGTDTLTQINALVAQWGSTVMGQLGYTEGTNEAFMTSYLRYQVAPTMCLAGVTACLTAAETQFRSLINTTTPVPADSRVWVYCNGLRYGTESDFTYMYTKYQQTNVYTEKIVLLSVLGCSPHQNSITTFVNAIIQDNYIIRPQDYTTAFSSAVTGNPGNVDIVFNLLRTNVAGFRTAFGSLYTPLSYITSSFQTTAQITEFTNWANQNTAVIGTELNNVLALATSAQSSLDWAASSQADVTTYLTQGGVEAQTTTAAPTTVVNPTTESRPNLVEPLTPELTDSATSVVLSSILLVGALVVNLL